MPRERAYIIVTEMPNKGEGDTPSENSQTGIIKAISNFSLTFYTKKGIRRVKEEYIK
jgi:hypothetical protein